ncbi:hypothetical protein C8Q76DRAFT_13449 [Earliella scabrosa]|nr:hypothetical protein C8Q76DRAFT_13449 [Earliella scabrosa]
MKMNDFFMDEVQRANADKAEAEHNEAVLNQKHKKLVLKHNIRTVALQRTQEKLVTANAKLQRHKAENTSSTKEERPRTGEDKEAVSLRAPSLERLSRTVVDSPLTIPNVDIPSPFSSPLSLLPIEHRPFAQVLASLPMTPTPPSAAPHVPRGQALATTPTPTQRSAVVHSPLDIPHVDVPSMFDSPISTGRIADDSYGQSLAMLHMTPSPRPQAASSSVVDTPMVMPTLPTDTSLLSLSPLQRHLLELASVTPTMTPVFPPCAVTSVIPGIVPPIRVSSPESDLFGPATPTPTTPRGRRSAPSSVVDTPFVIPKCPSLFTSPISTSPVKRFPFQEILNVPSP